MKYRREIDGLRALAIVPVILFHSGFRLFRAGFIGVDIFFVISGYLITSIILKDLHSGTFSILKFYERRARRILPVLFLVMALSSIVACQWTLPDELKNYGQSVVATTLFANNILLALTSGYWSLASEFKPLLHTWSLGVEEQYYLLFPLLLMLFWAFLRKRIAIILGVLATLSFAAACFGAYHFPDASFYLLPTRAWEILAGCLAAYFLLLRLDGPKNTFIEETMSGIGLLLILLSLFFLTDDPAKSQIYTAVPVLGVVLVIVFASETNIAGKLLGAKLMVGIGLISYSCYLWHQPLFAFARIYAKNAPESWVFTALTLLTFPLSYLSWRFIEQPCRNKEKVSTKAISISAFIASLIFISFGIYLDKSYGMLWRLYDPRVAPVAAMDKRIYNTSVLRYKKDHFADPEKLKILVIGNSFGRDFVNMTTETFEMKHIEIIYRDDLAPCIVPYTDPTARTLFGAANVIVFASNSEPECVQSDISFARQAGKEIFYVGSKAFGYNLNWVVRLRHSDLPNLYNLLPPEQISLENRMSADVPKQNYISLLGLTLRDGGIPITDENGMLISTDRAHVTKFGALFFGKRVLMRSRYGELLSNPRFIK